ERPRLVVSQGTADGRIPVGQLTAMWDDSAGLGSIQLNMVQDGGAGAFATAAGANINEATTSGTPIFTYMPLSAAALTASLASVNAAALLSDVNVIINL